MAFQTRLQDLRALVTGGAAGIGAAVVRRLAEEGARVAILDRDAAAAQALAEETGAAFAPVDLTDFPAVREAIARLGSRGGAVYSAAKAGLEAFGKSLAMENARYGITVNTVLPGPVDTPLLRQAVAEGGEKLLAAMEGSTLLRRLGRPEEVAAAVAFLASREAGFVTGETLGVSGGMPLA